jgi:hypothetical protein
MNGDDRTIIQDTRVESFLLAAKPDVASSFPPAMVA